MKKKQHPKIKSSDKDDQSEPMRIFSCVNELLKNIWQI